jgi:hypothetical protein
MDQIHADSQLPVVPGGIIAAGEPQAVKAMTGYSDVQLAARRSLAAMTLEGILTNRHQLTRTSCARSRRRPQAKAWRSPEPT